MSGERWQRLEMAYHDALARPPSERAAFLDETCGRDEALRRELQQLLAWDDRTGTFLDRPLVRAGDEATGPTNLTDDPELAPGHCIGNFRIVRHLGQGGMGRAYEAEDLTLQRRVALKLLADAPSRDGTVRERVLREARAASVLVHPHIVAVHAVGHAEGRDFIVMEYVEGETLRQTLARGPLPVDRTLALAVSIADALATAHGRGVVHRDVKPENVMLTVAGQAKLLDFGVACHEASATVESPSPTSVSFSARGWGTIAYMSPEQVEGKPIDARSDIFSFGVLLYETLCGRRPFGGETSLATLASILRGAPETPSQLRPGIPRPAERIILRCLEKNPDARYTSAEELRGDLEALRSQSGRRRASARAALIGVVATLALVAGAAGVGAYLRSSRATWVRERAIPDITALINANQRLAALQLFRRAERYASEPAALMTVAESAVLRGPVVFETTPPGARIYISDYTAQAGDDLNEWRFLGVTPFESNEIPVWGYYHVRAMKDGFAPVNRTLFLDALRDVTLRSTQDTPSGMTWVPEGPARIPVNSLRRRSPEVNLPGFWMDTYEVTNRQFKAFVDGGGYQNRRYWAQPFTKDGREISWDEAMAEFHDATGRAGPRDWQWGTFAEGAANLPVTGVSWYEAAAYASFVGKSLPTAYEWFAAAGAEGGNSDIVTLSNFGTAGPAPAGAHRGMSPYGSYDMAGNVKEWVASSFGGRRYLLGGAWNDGPYMFSRYDATSAWSREPTIGFRLVSRVSAQEATSDELVLEPDSVDRGQPVDDRTYQLFEKFHAYDKADLEARIEHTIELPYGRRETVSFRTAYGTERMTAHLFLPRDSKPPHQVVVLFGHSGIFLLRRVDDLRLPIEFVVRSGRALVIPEYFGTLARGPSPMILPPHQERERNLNWSMDLGRTLDYLETRPDLDVGKLAFYGVSLGAGRGPRLIAIEHRVKAAVLVTGRFYDHDVPEVNIWNFLPRVKIPVLMLNGRDDFIFPVDTHQRPLFEAIGTKEPDKVWRLYDGGHANLLTRPDVITEILGWLDKYLGPVDLRR